MHLNGKLWVCFLAFLKASSKVNATEEFKDGLNILRKGKHARFIIFEGLYSKTDYII